MTNEGNNPGAISTDIQMRLAEIFMPQAKRQMDKAVERQKKPEDSAVVQELRFVHYTSADAALKIIKSKRLWMRNAACMSDFREVQHGLDLLDRLFFHPAKTEIFINALDPCTPGAAGDAINLFKRWRSEIRDSTFITSVSEHDYVEDFHGRLSMWRGFGTNAPRVAIVLKVPKSSSVLVGLNVIFSPVAYLREGDVDEVLQEVITSVGLNYEFLRSIDSQLVMGSVFFMLLAAVTCLKHEGFREEREWRAIYCPKLIPSTLLESNIEIVAGVPQLVYHLPLDGTASPAFGDIDFARIFDRLIIGPSQFPDVMVEAFRDSLTNAGISDVHDRVCKSGIPVRIP